MQSPVRLRQSCDRSVISPDNSCASSEAFAAVFFGTVCPSVECVLLHVGSSAALSLDLPRPVPKILAGLPSRSELSISSYDKFF